MIVDRWWSDKERCGLFSEFIDEKEVLMIFG